jgi:proprotein convertase subtilisin/kexin type 5
VAFCSSCTSAIDCYACFSPYFLELTSCVTACDSGFYIYGQVCYLQCPVGTFTVSSTYSCSACVAPCLTCSDATTCLICVTGYFLEGNNCLTVCSSIYRFANSTSGNCETCPNPCITCAYQNNTMKCLSCAVGYLFNGSSCVFICPWGDYGFFLNGTSACLGCSPACGSCYINSTVCSSCSTGFLLLSTDCLAISTCPSAYFTNATYNQCIACHFPCATCTALTTCTSCIRGSLYGSTCWNQCPTGYYSSYANPQNISCIACVSPCLACISSTECRSCLTGFFLSQSNCLAVCPSDFYA